MTATFCRNGAILIDKPIGITSFNVISRVRKILNLRQVGHTGTLDPMATGLLVVLFGKATKLQDILVNEKKEYQGTIRLGIVTDSDDITGRIISQEDVSFSNSQQRDYEKLLCGKFRGVIEQRPPAFSAIKVDGRRSYALARKGVIHDHKFRNVEIFDADFKFIASNQIRYSVRCSKGTYIRSLARDIGELLGAGGTLESIRRTRNGSFNVADALSLEMLEANGDSSSSYLSVESLLEAMSKLTLSDDEIYDLSQGKQEMLKKYSPASFDTENIAVVSANGLVAAVLDCDKVNGIKIRFVF